MRYRMVNFKIMMKNLSFTVIALLMLASCSKHNEQDFLVSGTLLENCETKTPVGGVVVSYDMNGISYATATTNADGSFELSGTVKENFDNEDIPYLVISSYNQPGSTGVSYRKLARLPFEGAELDTMYEDMRYKVSIQLENASSYTDGDTLYISYVSPKGSTEKYRFNSYGFQYKRKYAAPFDPVIDTIEVEGIPTPFHAYNYPTIQFWINDEMDSRSVVGVNPTVELNPATMNLCKDVITTTLTVN